MLITHVIISKLHNLDVYDHNPNFMDRRTDGQTTVAPEYRAVKVIKMHYDYGILWNQFNGEFCQSVPCLTFSRSSCFPDDISSLFHHFYRAMHYSAKRGIAIACMSFVCPSVCLSVCDDGGSGSHRLEIFETNCTDN